MEKLRRKGQIGSPVSMQERESPDAGPPVLPHLLVSWKCPHSYIRTSHYLSWGPSLAVILCGKSQHTSQQVLWLLSVWKANRRFYGKVRDKLGRGSTDLTPTHAASKFYTVLRAKHQPRKR